MTIDELDIIPFNNYVVVKPDLDRSSTNVRGLAADTTFNPHEHAPNVGTVVAVPQTLDFQEDDPSGMPWETDMELRVGDEVTYHYLSAQTAEDKHTPRFFEFNGDKYYFIKYDRIYTARRKVETTHEITKEAGLLQRKVISSDVIIMLNGFVLVEPLPEQENEKYKQWLVLSDIKDATLGRVKYTGSLVTNYGLVYADWHGPDMDNISPGDVVAMDKHCNIPLQYRFHANIDDDKEFYRVQRRYVLGKIED